MESTEIGQPVLSEVEEIMAESTEATESLTQPAEDTPPDHTVSFATIFVMGVIFGFLIFKMLSRRWN